MNEIYSLGPVTAGFNVYSDWLHYPAGSPSSGVYKPAGGDEMGSHAVRMIGWGVSQDTKYWSVNRPIPLDYNNNNNNRDGSPPLVAADGSSTITVACAVTV